jgi:predicted GNAT family acetyltransferase
MADYLRETPMENPIMGLLADRLKKAQQFAAKPFGYENPPVEMLMNLLGVPAVQQTMERMAYGEPLTTGRGMTTKPRAEAVEAAMAVAPVAGLLAKTTKGLPVGASIEKIGKFDIVKRDASEIFGEGAQRIRYIDPKSNGQIEVLARQDGTASVLSLEVPEKFRGQKIGESLQKQVLQDFPDMQGQVSSKAAATTAYRLGRRPVDMPNATLKDVHKMIDEDSSVNLISPQMQERINPSTSYPQQEALDTAQRNAALPVEQGGLGLPKDNTPEMRAEAMGFDINTIRYHGSDKDISAFDPAKFGKNDQGWYGRGITTDTDPEIASGYANYNEAENGQAVYPLLTRGKYMDWPEGQQPFASAKDSIQGTKDIQGLGYQGTRMTNDRDLYGNTPQIGTEQVTFNPANVRSRFAAFDPMRKNEADILAGVLPLGLLADEEQRKKLYELMPSLLGE